ncbi:MAG TPA: DUF3419 family protein [Aliidongia sp.]|nr:DUF3419 family protein [Aliidongia sp.]
MPDGGIASRARFDLIRYAQVWEDADVLTAALAVAPGATLVSIASAGDNALALLTLDPARVIAVDLSEAQLACLALRIEAYRTLDHTGLLELMGSRPSARRGELLARAASRLDTGRHRFWAERRDLVERHGIGGVGRFERYFRLFRRYMLPLVHGAGTVHGLLEPRSAEARARYYARWNSLRWRLLLRLFFARWTMARLGRDPAFFDFAEGDLPSQVADRARSALVDQDPAANPYLAWILTGRHQDALPLALRAEHFDTIRARLDRIELHHGALEAIAQPGLQADGWNLSDIFEYMAPAEHETAYRRLLAATRPGGRLVYWNMLAPRACPPALAGQVIAHGEAAAALHRRDKAFFYRTVVIEERRP